MLNLAQSFVTTFISVILSFISFVRGPVALVFGVILIVFLLASPAEAASFNPPVVSDIDQVLAIILWVVGGGITIYLLVTEELRRKETKRSLTED